MNKYNKLTDDNNVTNHVKNMFINRNGLVYYISKIENPRIWYHINLRIPRYGEDYIKSKLGVTDPEVQRRLQDEFYRAINSKKIQQTDLLEEHNLRLDKIDYPFYLVNQTKSSVSVFMEKGFFTLSEWHPGGYPWAVINSIDSPQMIQEKLFDHRKRFGIAMYKKLRKICSW